MLRIRTTFDRIRILNLKKKLISISFFLTFFRKEFIFVKIYSENDAYHSYPGWRENKRNKAKQSQISRNMPSYVK